MKTTNLRWIARNMDYLRVPLNATERAEMPGSIPYWGANGIVDYVNDSVLDERVILIGEDGAPFFERDKDVAFISEGAAWINNHIHILKPDERVIDDRFLKYFLNQVDYSLYINGSTRDKLTQSQLGNISVSYPDLATQRQIADFLDLETARIDLLIEKKQRLVALLGEKYFADLESVTFPEDTPADEFVPFRWICRIAEGQVDPTSETWRDRMLIAPNHIESKTGRLLATETAEEQGAISGKYAFSKGTVLYSKIRPALAKACIAPSSGMCSADMYPIIPDKRLRPEYLLMQLLSARFTDWATLESMRVAMPKINRETLGGFRLRVPPIPTQDQYVREFALHRAQFEAVTDKINASIDRLKEYRSALITAAVTGQIDVSTYVKSGIPDRRLDAIQEEMGA